VGLYSGADLRRRHGLIWLAPARPDQGKGEGKDMERHLLGRTGTEVSVVGFGAGPVAGLMTGADADAQRQVVARP